MRGAGADGFVVPSKPGNAGGGRDPTLRPRRPANQRWEEPVSEAKPFDIPKQLVWDAYQRVKANRGAAGVDGESLAAFETDLKRNLYKVWNRMASDPTIRRPCGSDTEGNGRHAPPRHSDRSRPRGADSRDDGPGAAGGTTLPP